METPTVKTVIADALKEFVSKSVPIKPGEWGVYLRKSGVREPYPFFVTSDFTHACSVAADLQKRTGLDVMIYRSPLSPVRFCELCADYITSPAEKRCLKCLTQYGTRGVTSSTEKRLTDSDQGLLVGELAIIEHERRQGICASIVAASSLNKNGDRILKSSTLDEWDELIFAPYSSLTHEQKTRYQSDVLRQWRKFLALWGRLG